jgi:hypothetical protein
MSVAQPIPDNIKRVSRALGDTLLLDHPYDWFGLSIILRARVDTRQRAALALMALQSLEHDQAMMVAEASLSEGAGQPIAPLFSNMDEAAFWADMATPDELDAYTLASFNQMAPQRQAAFLGFVQRRAAA